MKKTIISAVVFASMFVVGTVPNAKAGQCSNASLEGAYGFLDVHTLVPAGTPFVGLGRWHFDGKGNFTNTFTSNDNGTVGCTMGAVSTLSSSSPTARALCCRLG